MKKLRIGAVTYSVKHVEALKDGDTELLGCIRSHEETIYLRKGMPRQTAKIVFLHEVIHGLLNHAGTQEHSEQVIDAIAYAMLDLSRTNPGFIKFDFEGFVE